MIPSLPEISLHFGKLINDCHLVCNNVIIQSRSFIFSPFFPAPRDAIQQSRGPHGVNGGSAPRSLLWWREHVHAARHGASIHGRLKEAVPSSSSTTATAARGTGRPKTRVNCTSFCVRGEEKEGRKN